MNPPSLPACGLPRAATNNSSKVEMSVPSAILELVERFEHNKEAYLASRYNEAQLRREFIDPMFRQLGWDIENTSGYAEAYKDVVHEDSLKIGDTSKAPDYAFRIGGTRKFFLEAKKPSKNITEDADSAYQLRRYAWSAKLPISILTNFRTLAVYDCRIKPEKSDKASTARILHIQYDEYADSWDDLSATFSREAILKGAFDKYASDSSKKRGTTEVDDAFLEDIEKWREALSRNIHLRNSTLDTRDLNAAVQRTIDRIIFLRIAEDRGMEPYGRLRLLKEGKNLYSRLCEYFRQADDRYNSGLFHFRKGDGAQETLDTFSLDLKIDDITIKRIIQSLYYPDSPYEFSVLPADILGQIYERFLGKTIKIERNRITIDEKPEVKRAGGVYYTPTYIVRYIVLKTLAALLKNRTPSEASGQDRRRRDSSPLRILDPACGSGSFLIEAYQYLLDWYRERYVEDGPHKHSRGKNAKLHVSPTGDWALTIEEKKRILLDHIFGVDIDPQAVEVTKLSLLLKVLEGESGDGLARQMDFFRSRPLPDLGANIRCGNSLIAPDFYSDANLDFFGAEEQYRINAFSWAENFPFLKEGKGFDVVLGNPPYIFARELMLPHEKEYYHEYFKHSWDKQNTFMLFMEKILSLVRPDGRASFIVPNSWLTIESAKFLRELYIPRLLTVVDMNFSAFRRVSMEPSIFVAQGKPHTGRIETQRIAKSSELTLTAKSFSDAKMWVKHDGRIHIDSDSRQTVLLSGIQASSRCIGDVFDVRTGLQAYERGKGTPPQTAEDVANHVFDRDRRENEDSYRYLQGGDVNRYNICWSGMWMQYGPWLSQPREIQIFTRPRILIREITGRLPHCIRAALATDEFLNNKSVLNVLHHENDLDQLKCLLGVLNSTPFSIYYKARAVKGARTLFPKLVINNLRELPYPRSIGSRDRVTLVGLVDRMAALQMDLRRAKSEHQREVTNRLISEIDRRIDVLVAQLFKVEEANVPTPSETVEVRA
ncbi:N-6 DNA methylase [Bradyrhizobium sp. BRP22]|uniref:Eco57I restriction-modification methylase domain-containing protein n=1 Tax=Bradyrhizobium sp. BRP22 TaxID=2793821 RepID=UPI001CD79DF6|nr:TaqI-like C-terminal specificity domain-containing protein [Bradyrhizobium sp. BRP22]MCA1455502.1 N-6 DNA methylase [Bradyrhizobium sp. BRP22]